MNQTVSASQTHLSYLLHLVDAALPHLTRDERPSILGVPEGAKAATLAALALRAPAGLVVVSPRADRGAALAEAIGEWLGDSEAVALFPEMSMLLDESASRGGPIDNSLEDAIPATAHRSGVDNEAAQLRLTLLEHLRRGTGPRVLVASILALGQQTIAPELLSAASESIHCGDVVILERLIERLGSRSYRYVPLVEEPGELSRRGGIVDVFPPGLRHPVRIEFFGDRIESLRTFDSATQRSLESLDTAEIGPAGETIRAFRPDLDGAGDPSERERAATLLDHLAGDTWIVVDEPPEVQQALEMLDEQAAMSSDGRATDSGRLGLVSSPARLERTALLKALGDRSRFAMRRWAAEGADGASVLPFGPPGAFGGRLRNLAQELIARLRSGWKVVIASQQAARLRELFDSEGIQPSLAGEGTLQPGQLWLLPQALTQGWALLENGAGLLLLTDNEIFGFTRQRRAVHHERAGLPGLLSEISPGDYVVHIEHGIGRFTGLVTRAKDGIEREYLELHYAEGDKLFVPSDQIGRIGRYVGPGEQSPSLTRLGTQEWTRAKQRVQHAVTVLAEELLRVYAAREVLPGHNFRSDTPWQQELEGAFPYVETPDQVRAMSEIKRDMESSRPMDRVIVGDVGYGKTELAIRAAFKAVMEGAQVAILVPTTVLAEQHLQTFRDRLSAFPVGVEALSRFRSEREQHRILKDLAAGQIDIVVGTHRLLQQDVQFKSLELLIIDEEQRFGVAHKERLRTLRAHIDVLALSATPIPRTLHMTLSGIRDMSLMETAPEDRLPIKTFVAEWDDRLVRDAILREIDRGGQVYLVHNRVQTIEPIAAHLRHLLPEVSVIVGHGQMPEEQLERAMIEFARGKHSVLVCTTIIESGLDIPNVNTIIISRADRFGLSQLYQLRGRVGRGANHAYAYLLYDRDHVLSEIAQKRLQSIFEATELGAGFQIALKDLELRGAGNLLGSEQSGHIGAVGFDLYNRMLAEAVRRLQAEAKGIAPPPAQLEDGVSIDLPVQARIPESYIPDLSLRLAVYQRMAEAWTAEEVSDLAQEIEDRFGSPPSLVENLLSILRLKVVARRVGLASITMDGSTIVLRSNGPIKGRERLNHGTEINAEIGITQVRLPITGHPDQWLRILNTVLELLAGTN